MRAISRLISGPSSIAQRKPFDTMLSRLDTLHERDVRADRQNIVVVYNEIC